MKKRIMAAIFVFIFSAAMLLSFSGCKDEGGAAAKTTQEPSAITAATAESKATEQPSAGEEKTSATNNEGGGTIKLQKYRMCYYSVPAPFVALVGKVVYTEYAEVYEVENPSVTNEMIMKKFIQHFNISREDFDRANEEWARIIADNISGTPLMNPQDFANQEMYEVYNADIIYTFDDEIINEYYLSHDYPFVYELEYEKAVEAGTYQTRTKDFVTVTPAPSTTAE